MGAGGVFTEKNGLAAQDVDRGEPFGLAHGQFQRIGQPVVDPRLHDQAVDHHIDGVLQVLVERPHIFDVHGLAIHADLGKPLFAELSEKVLVPSFLVGDDGRKDDDLCSFGKSGEPVDDLVDGLGGDGPAADVAMGPADPGEEQPQIIVNLGDGAYRRPGIVAGGLLFDGDGRRESFDQVDVRLVHALQKLSGVCGQRLHIPTLPFGIECIEGQGGFSRTRQAGHHDEFGAGDGDVDIFEIVLSRTLDNDIFRCHDGIRR